MNYLKNSKMYLSGPLEYYEGANWRIEPTKVFTERFGIDVFDPYIDPKQNWSLQINEAKQKKDYAEMARIAKGFVKKDLAMVDRCDFLIACLPFKVPTTGSHFEIYNSINLKKPSLIICPEGKEKIPVWYFGVVKQEYLFGSWEEVYNYLDEVDKGLHQDNHRWNMVYKLV